MHCPLNVKITFLVYSFKVITETTFVSTIIQQDTTIHSLFISANCSTRFGWYLHPPSAAHITLYTVSGIIETVTAICCEHSWVRMTGGSNGLNNASYCRYSDMRS